MNEKLGQVTMSGHENGQGLSSQRVAIVGLGLMGGSLAMALRNKVHSIVGIDIDTASRVTALERGVVDEVVDRLEHGVARADLVVLAVPVEGIVALLKELPVLRPEGCLVLDLGSTKREIVSAMDVLPAQFGAIGGHPMCGRELSGFDAATHGLYQNQTFVLCRSARTTRLAEEIALELVAAIGARPLFLEPADHDALVAVSSHLPYVVSALLMGRAWVEASRDERVWDVSASGLRDITRLAGSNPQMMLEIMITNRAPLLAQIEAYGRELEGLAEALRNVDRPALQSLLETSATRRAEYLQAKLGRREESA